MSESDGKKEELEAGDNPEGQAAGSATTGQEPTTHQVVNPFEHAVLFEDWYQRKFRRHASLVVPSGGEVKMDGIVSQLCCHNIDYNCSDRATIDWYRPYLQHLIFRLNYINAETANSRSIWFFVEIFRHILLTSHVQSFVHSNNGGYSQAVGWLETKLRYEKECPAFDE